MRKLSEIERELVRALEHYLYLESQKRISSSWFRWYEKLEAELISLVGEMFAELTMYKTLRIAALKIKGSER